MADVEVDVEKTVKIRTRVTVEADPDVLFDTLEAAAREVAVGNRFHVEHVGRDWELVDTTAMSMRVVR